MTTPTNSRSGASQPDLGANQEGTRWDTSALVSSRLTEPEAHRLTTKIQLRLEVIADNIEVVVPMIAEARNGDAHTTLGYRSWGEYVADKFGGTLARLTKIERIPVVELLAEEGMSTRAIASVVGVSKDTVSRELRAGVSSDTPDHGDAKEQLEAALTGAGAQGDLSGGNVVSIIPKTTPKIVEKKIVGIDGKSYTRPEPVEPKPRRRPLPDAYWDAIYDLEKIVKRLERLHRDDRFLVNRKSLIDKHARGLSDLNDRLFDLDGDLSDTPRVCHECDERLVPGEGDPLRNRCSGGCR